MLFKMSFKADSYVFFRSYTYTIRIGVPLLDSMAGGAVCAGLASRDRRHKHEPCAR